MINVGELMSDPDFVRPLTRKRATLALANEGIFTPSYDTGTPIMGATEPGKQSDLQYLPQGTHLSDVLRVSTSADVRAGSKTEAADLLLVDGEKYQALHKLDFSQYGYVTILAQRLYR